MDQKTSEKFLFVKKCFPDFLNYRRLYFLKLLQILVQQRTKTNFETLSRFEAMICETDMDQKTSEKFLFVKKCFPDFLNYRRLYFLKLLQILVQQRTKTNFETLSRFEAMICETD